MSHVITSEINTEVINQLFDKQRKHALTLRNETVSDRKKKLKTLHKWILKNRQLIAQAVHNDFKKPLIEAEISEIYPVLTEIRHALANLSKWAKPKKIDAPLTMLGTTSHIQYEPKGVCLILAPWNYPFNLTIGPLISAIAAGNTAMIKPSEMTPNTSHLIEQMIGDLFQEREIVVLNGGVEVSQKLLSLPFDHIFFTGSPQIGKIVMKAAAEHLTSVTLELGGKSPVVIDKSANLKDAAEKISWGKFLNNGQTCVAPDYILIEESKKQEFVNLLKGFIKKQFDNGDKGFENSPDYTRIVNEKNFVRITELLDDALAKGANLELSGEAKKNDRYIPPTILSDVPDNARIMEEEIFGPLLPIKTYNDITEAVNYINSKPKPLALYYFGKSHKNRNVILTSTSAGGVCVNDCVLQFSHVNIPFGGVNNSGIGKSHGYHGFIAFSNEKPVLKQRTGFTTAKLVYPPYTNFVSKLINFLSKYF